MKKNEMKTMDKRATPMPDATEATEPITPDRREMFVRSLSRSITYPTRSKSPPRFGNVFTIHPFRVSIRLPSGWLFACIAAVSRTMPDTTGITCRTSSSRTESTRMMVRMASSQSGARRPLTVIFRRPCMTGWPIRENTKAPAM